MTVTTIHGLIEQQSVVSANKIALQFAEQSLSYQSLNEHANQLAHWLIDQGISQPDQLIPIIFDRNINMLVAILAILKSGAAYVPISSNWPVERIRHIVEDCGVNWVLTQQQAVNKYPTIFEHIKPIVIPTANMDQYCGTNPVTHVQGQHLMYGIFTSGSTGKPKGVLVEHRNVIHLFHAINEHLKLGEHDRFLALSAYTFDISVLELLLPLTQGACCVIAEQDLIQNSRSVDTLIRQEEITAIQATPALWQLLLEQDCHFPPQLKVLCGGEALTPNVAKLMLKQFPQFWNVYGPTETTIWSTLALIHRNMQLGDIPIGKALGQTRLWVLNKELHPVKPNEPGELYISGPGVVRGYLNQPEQSQQQFISGSIIKKNNTRLYRTGDLVRMDETGQLYYLNRIDDQIKINGHRVELKEIESHLSAYPLISKAVVVVKETNNIKQLYACLVKSTTKTLCLDSLQAFLIKKLPSYMMPHHFFLLSTLPLTPHGKVDKKQILKQCHASNQLKKTYTAAQTGTEQWLSTVWSEVLNLASNAIGQQSNFFLSGGHSLHAAQVITRVNQQRNLSLVVADLYHHPTLEAFALLVDNSKPTSMKCLAIAKTLQVDRTESPLSFSQERLWFAHQATSQSTVYNMSMAWQITGKVNIPALVSAIQSVKKRHDILRTVFINKNGALVQQVQPFQAAESVLSHELLEGEWQDRIIQKPFQLDKGPLIRFHLLSHEYQNHHVFVICMHHIIGDEWTVQILLKELGYFYHHGPLAHLTALPYQYTDFANWQRQVFTTATLEAQIKYWQKQLAGLPVLDLPTDKPRSAKQSFSGNQIKLIIPSHLFDKINRFSQQTSTSLFSVAFTALSILCARYSHQKDFAIGTVVANRNLVEFEQIMGPFINTLPLRVEIIDDLDGLTLLKNNQKSLLDALTHQDLPFDKMVEKVNPTRDPSQSPLFQVMLVLQNMPHELLHLEGSEVRPLDVDIRVSQIDLTMVLTPLDDALQCCFIYNDHLFQTSTIQRLSRHFIMLLEALVDHPDQSIYTLPLLTPQEKEWMFEQWQPTKVHHQPILTLNAVFEQQVKLNPHHIALVMDEKEMTYFELNQKANILAHLLKQQYQIGRGSRIIIMAERSFAMIIAVLAVLKTGGTYIPLDNRQPIQRVLNIASDCQAELLLSHDRYIKQCQQHPAWDDLHLAYQDLDQHIEDLNDSHHHLPALHSEQDIAYIIYTSGSTGKPKGVMIKHEGVVNTVLSQVSLFEMDSSSRVLQFASFGFDSSVGEIFRPLLIGATLVISHPDQLIPGDTLAHTIKAQKITVLTQPPAALALLPKDNDLPLKTLITAGESCPMALLEYWSSRVLFINAYGPTEASICATVAVGHCYDDKVTIGKPIPNVRAYVLDNQHQPLPINVWGTLYLGGTGVSPGYVNREALTRTLFIPDPFSPHAKMYQTGDKVRWLEDGNLEFSGRYDEQIKIRGFRIEPQEVSDCIKKFPFIDDCVVMANTTSQGTSLFAFIISTHQPVNLCQDLRSFLSAQLPYYMIPDRLIVIDEIPRTPNQKIDKTLLLQQTNNLPKSAAAMKPWRSTTEKQLALVFEHLLGIQGIGPDDNFFECGGHSLLIIQLSTNIEHQFNKKVPIHFLIAHPTIDAIAKYIDDETNLSETLDFMIPFSTTGHKTSIYFIHETSGFVSPYNDIASHLSYLHPVYGIQDPNIDQTASFQSIEEMAACYIKAIKKQQPRGPYIIAGWCMGGIIAFEMAQNLLKYGDNKVYLIMIDTPADISNNNLTLSSKQEILDIKKNYDDHHFLNETSMINKDEFIHRRAVEIAHRNSLMRQYVAKPYNGNTLLLCAKTATAHTKLIDCQQWQGLIDNLTIHHVNGTHDSLLQHPNVVQLADLILKHCCEQSRLIYSNHY